MLHDALRLVRVFHDLNKSEAARKIGISKSYIGELESGEKKVTLEVLDKYARAFGIPVSSLMIFAERISNDDAFEGARISIADKVIKMLDWLALIGDEENGNRTS